MTWLFSLAFIVAVMWAVYWLDRRGGCLLDEDWTPYEYRTPLDRVDLLELPYSPWFSDVEVQAMFDEVAALPEVGA